jgi:hypothetical protein
LQLPVHERTAALSAALQTGTWVSVGTPGLFALLAGRRTQPPWWKRATLVATFAGFGALVVAVEVVAHG